MAKLRGVWSKTNASVHVFSASLVPDHLAVDVRRGVPLGADEQNHGLAVQPQGGAHGGRLGRAAQIVQQARAHGSGFAGNQGRIAGQGRGQQAHAVSRHAVRTGRGGEKMFP